MTSPTSHSLRAAGLRVTPQRRSILEVMEATDRPLTVEEIRARMADPQPGLPTIYRNLEHFVQQGWAESLLGHDQAMRFVRCRSEGHHHHIQCETCGRTVEVGCCGLESVLGELQTASGFQINRHQLQLFGTCGNCIQE
jgi:Fe2+ or Zn2+ uptake regulation protein